MASSVIGALRVMLGMDTSEFEAGSTRTQREAQRLERRFKRLGQSMQRIGVGMTAALTVPLAALANSSFEAGVKSREAFAQVESALASMGGVSGRTAGQLTESAKAIEDLTNFNDTDVLRQVTANMLTFGNVAGEAFDRGQMAAIDMAARLDKDLQSATIMVGKALNDPVRGMSALGEAGIQFDDTQREVIKRMVETGDVAGAQSIILAELERQYGGAAKAARDAAPGGDSLQAWTNLKEIVGERLVVAFEAVERVLAPIVRSFSEISPGMQTAIVVMGGVAAAAGPLLIALGGLVTLAPAIAAGFAAVGAAAAPIAAVVAGVAAAGYLIYENWDRIAPVLQGVSDQFNNVLGPKVQSLIDTVSGKFRELWDGPLGDGIRAVFDLLLEFQGLQFQVFGEVLTRVLDGALTAFSGTFNAILDLLTVVSRLLQGDFRGAWEAMQDFVIGVSDTVVGVINAFVPEVVQMGRDIMEGLISGIKAAPGMVFDALMGVISYGVDGIRSYLGINSPSLMFIGFGRNISEGLAIGIEDGSDEVERAMTGLATITEQAGAKIENSFESMSRNVLGSLRKLTSGIKSGSILDILDGVLGALSGFGVFGGGGSSAGLPTGGILGGGEGTTMPFNIPGFANGGSMTLGGAAGLDSNLLSLNGSPLARVSRGENMTITPANDRGSAVTNNYYTLPSDQFWDRVDGRAAGVVSQVAPAIASAGAGQALKRLRHSNERKLA